MSNKDSELIEGIQPIIYTGPAATTEAEKPLVTAEVNFVREPLAPVVDSDSDEFTLDDVLHEGNAVSQAVEEVPVETIPPVIEASVAVEVPTPVTDEFDIDSELEESPVLPTIKQNVTQDFPTSSPKTSGTPDTIEIPPATADVIKQQMDKSPNVDMIVSTQQHRWAEVLRSSIYHMPMENLYVDRLAEAGCDFRQQVSQGNASLRGRAPSYKKKPGETIVEGESALLQLITHLGVGGLFRAPLWNSGIWVTFKPATEAELLELNRIIQADKIQAGRWSYGLALSNNVVYTLDRVFDFALAHVYNTSIKSDELPIYQLRDWIAPQDINSFIWGFLCASYPSGFHYETSCVADPSKCNHVLEETLNVTKLQWTDTSLLTDWQKQHMSSMAANGRTLDSLKRYREEMTRLQPTRVILNEGSEHEIAFTIQTPTVTEYINQGHRWIGGMVESVNSVLGMDANDELRNTTINKLNKATTLCQYSHWIKSIEYGDLTEQENSDVERSVSRIEDRASIEENLKTLSAIDSIREKIIDKILEYIGHSTISVIGVPAYECPVCGSKSTGETNYPRHTNIVPLDLIQVFFALLGRRLNRIEIRSDR